MASASASGTGGTFGWIRRRTKEGQSETLLVMMIDAACLSSQATLRPHQIRQRKIYKDPRIPGRESFPLAADPPRKTVRAAAHPEGFGAEGDRGRGIGG